MAWLDKILAWPTIGLLFTPEVRSQQEYIQILSTRISQWMKDGRSVEFQQPNPVGLIVDTSSGFMYVFSPESLNVQFMYKQKSVDRPGQFPHLEPHPAVRPYSALLETAFKEISDLINVLITNRRTLRRIGIVADSRLDISAPPPGILDLINFLQKPWGCQMDVINGQITPILSKTASQTERCHHTLHYDNTNLPEDLRLKLDWQRNFDEQISVNAQNAIKQVKDAIDAATAYFERFGRGDLNYGTSHSAV